MKTLAEVQKSTSEVTDNILEGDFDLYDYINQQADSDERTMYYYQAEKYVLNHDDRDSLEEEWREYWPEFTDLSTLFCQLAFFGVRKELQDSLKKDICNDLSLMNEALEELEELLISDSDNEEIHDAIQELEDAIQELEEYE